MDGLPLGEIQQLQVHLWNPRKKAQGRLKMRPDFMEWLWSSSDLGISEQTSDLNYGIIRQCSEEPSMACENTSMEGQRAETLHR